jgi:hypothetical protein
MRSSVSRLAVRPVLLGIFSTLILSACASVVPDMTPFAEQTARMRSGVTNGYTETQTLLLHTDLASESVAGLDRAWRQTRTTLNALVGYSQALADLARTGAQGGEAAARMTDALTSVTSTLDVPGIPANIASAIGALNDYIARVRTRAKLEDILTSAQPAVDTIASIVAQNLAALEGVNELAAGAVRIAFEQESETVTDYYEGLQEEDRRILKVLTIFLERAAARDSNDGAAAEARLDELLGADPVLEERVIRLQIADPDTWGDHLEPLLEERQGFLRDRSVGLQAEARRYQPAYDAYQARRAEIEGLRVNGGEILRKSAGAVRAWARAHRKLLTSLEQEWSFVHLVEFTTAVQEVYDAYKGE